MIWLLIYFMGYVSTFGMLLAFCIGLEVADAEDFESADFGVLAVLSITSWLGFFAWIAFALIGIYKKRKRENNDS